LANHGAGKITLETMVPGTLATINNGLNARNQVSYTFNNRKQFELVFPITSERTIKKGIVTLADDEQLVGFGVPNGTAVVVQYQPQFQNRIPILVSFF
jgi:hypothetical protein